MKKLINIFLERFGWVGFVRLIFYPLSAFVTTPIRLVQTLWNCRVLAEGRWGEYSHFVPFNGINSLFYWTAALNLYRFGRTGFCPYIGLGNYPLSRYFHYSLFSLFSYWGGSTVTVLFGMFGWLLIHLIWIGCVNTYWVVTIIFLIAISTTFYASTFVLQNYNALGWLFFPLGIYGIAIENWIIVGTAWFLASLGSPTVVFIASIISVVNAVTIGSLAPIYTLVPAGLKLLTHFYPLIVSKNIKFSVLNLMKAIGLCSKTTKYRYAFPLETTLVRLYFLLLYVQFFIVVYLIGGTFPAIFLTGIIIFILNSTYLPFADGHHIQLLMVSLSAIYAFRILDPRVIISFWLVISPLPFFIPFPFMKSVLDIVPVAAPFSIMKLQEDMENFLSPVNLGEKVLMVFDNPGGMFNRVFDGYRVLVELPFYIASKKKIHLMPDWWAVFELNYENAPEFWGRDVKSVLKNVKFWKAGYAVIYQKAGTELEPKWQSTGFRVLAKFSWADYHEELRGVKPYLGETPDWWLLKIPATLMVE